MSIAGGNFQSTYCYKFLLSTLYIDGHLLDVIVNPIKHRPLVDDHCLQVFEDVCKFNDTLGDVVDFSLPLFDGSVVAVVGPLH